MADRIQLNWRIGSTNFRRSSYLLDLTLAPSAADLRAATPARAEPHRPGAIRAVSARAAIFCGAVCQQLPIGGGLVSRLAIGQSLAASSSQNPTPKALVCGLPLC